MRVCEGEVKGGKICKGGGVAGLLAGAISEPLFYRSHFSRNIIRRTLLLNN